MGLLKEGRDIFTHEMGLQLQCHIWLHRLSCGHMGTIIYLSDMSQITLFSTFISSTLGKIEIT